MEKVPHRAILASRPKARQTPFRLLRLRRRYSAVQKKRRENQTVLLEEEGGKVTRERRQRGGDADEICVNCELID